MTDRSYLRSGSLNTGQLYEFIRKAFLDRIVHAGTLPSKGLAIDPDMIGVIGRVAEYSALRECGVEHQCLFPLDGRRIPASCPPNLIFFCRPQVAVVKQIASIVRDHQKAGVTKEYTLYFIPFKTVVCEQALESEGVRGNFHAIDECPLLLAPLDYDLLSMSLPLAFRECQLLGDKTSVYQSAQAIMQLQLIYGVIPRIVGKGDTAKALADMLVRLNQEQRSTNLVPSEIESLIIIDRSTDLITPLRSQLTYEGLIDEIYGIDNSIARLPPHLKAQDPNGKALTCELNSSDSLYAALRDLEFSNVGPILNKTAKNLAKQEKEGKESKSISQLKQFTSKIKRLLEEKASVELHTNIATELRDITRSDAFRECFETEQAFVCGIDLDKVNEYIEDSICRQEPLIKVLRLVCLQSLVASGLKKAVLESYMQDIRQAYGFSHTLSLENLQQAGIIRAQDGRFAFEKIRKQFKLIVEDVAEGTDDISYVFSGFAPLSARLVQYMARSETTRNLDEALKLIPGSFVCVDQSLPDGLSQQSSASEGQTRQRVSLVFFIGGCTFSEVAALRMLGQQEGRSFIIATTDLINGNTFLSSLFEELPPMFVPRDEAPAAATAGQARASQPTPTQPSAQPASAAAGAKAGSKK